MKNTFKKLLSVLLCAVLLFTTASTALAAEDAEAVLEENYACHNYYSNGFIVVTFSSKYSQTGEKPEVQLYNGSNTLSITEDEITLKIFEYEGERYPQLFINTKADTDKIKGIEIAAGAFVTESGEISGKVKIPNNRINRAYDLGVSCKLEVFEVEEHIDLISGRNVRYATVGKPVEIVGYGEYGKVWLGETTATYTIDGETTEITSNEFVPQEPGKYVVELKFGDITTRKFEFDVLSETKSYTKSLGDATVWLLLTPLYALVGTGLLLIPGLGTWIGSTTLVGVVAMIPRFFKALFGGPMYKEYILE